MLGGLLLTRPAAACPLPAGCHHPCCRAIEIYFDFYGKRKCKCTEWDYVCLGLAQPPVLEAALECQAWGGNGWCIGDEALDLNASDPQGGEIMISGDVNGEAFACPASTAETTCLVPLPEGAGTVNYTAVAASSGLTASGATNYQRDSLPPQIDGALNGIPGQNNWYTSAVTVSASASDPQPGSALAAFTYALDGGLQTAWPGALNLTDGLHTLTLRATDNAGNQAETTQTVNVDSLTPTLTLSPSGTQGNNGWYLSPLQITAAASDSGSGLASIEYTLDGGAWTAYTAPLTIPDGAHSYQFRATDNAGNTTQTPAQTANIDTQPPAITLPQSWPLGRSADYTVADPSAGSGQAGSGLSSVRVVITDQQERYPKVHWDEAPSGAAFAGAIDWDGLWADKSKAQPGEYLAWVKAADNAGNESFAVGKIRVEGKNAFTIPLPSLPTATALPPLPTPAASYLIPDTSHPSPDTSHPAPDTPKTTRFHAANNPLPKSPTAVPLSTIMWGGAAAGAAGAFLAESLRRKKEREKRLAAYQNRPKVEAEGKGGRLTGKQIAKAWQAAMQKFKAKLLKDNLTEAEADVFVKQARVNGSITSVQGAANKYIEKRNEASRRDIPPWQKNLSKLISIGALTLDITSLAISSSGALLETIFTALGLAEPTPGGGETVGFVTGATVYKTVLNPIENAVSLLSAFLVTGSDILAGNTRLEQSSPFPGIHATELVVGQDTLVAWGGIAFGNTPLTPEAFTDTAVNAGIVYYDVQRLREQIPDYVSCRIGKTEGGTLYFRCLSEDK